MNSREQTAPEVLQTLTNVISPKSRWTAEAIANFLTGSLLPMRISTVNAKGYPQITSLWFSFRHGQFLCCTQPESLVCRHIRANSRVGFEIAVNDPPYLGVSGQGDARIVEGDTNALLQELTSRYLKDRDPRLKDWLISRAATEVIIAMEPQRITSWDFRQRMTAPHD